MSSSGSARPVESRLKTWLAANYSAQLDSMRRSLRVAYVVFAFLAAFFIGGAKALIVGPVASVIAIVGNVGVILILFPAHVAWTIYTVINTNRVNAAIKLAMLIALPELLVLWLGLSILGSVLIGLGYSFATPWMSTFEAFRGESETQRFLHGIVDGTWETIKGSCTIVGDFADLCFHSYPEYLKELRMSSEDREQYSLSLLDVPTCIIVALLGLIVDVPLYTMIALIKSPYMLFKGWQRLLHDLISREGPFLETVCVPIAGFAILFWPLVVVGSFVLAIVYSIFAGLYGAVIVYQEKSFRRGLAYVIAVVAEFDEYTNDWLYLREGTILPKPNYRKRKPPISSELSARTGASKSENTSGPSEPPALLVPKLAPARSVKDALQEVKMVQIWENIMRSYEMRGTELLDSHVIAVDELTEWLKAKDGGHEKIDLGLPSYSLLHTILDSVNAGSSGLLLLNGIEVTQHNRPQDRLLDWFFHPVLVLKEQIRVLKMTEGELKFLQKLVLFVGNISVASGWDNGSEIPRDPVRMAQIQAISRRMVGIVRSISKFPTYRRRFKKVVNLLISYYYSHHDRDGSYQSSHLDRSVSVHEITPAEV